jgi:hypothetical protein
MVNDLTMALFGQELLNTQMSFKDTLALLQKLDLINVGELAEKAISKKIGIDQACKCQSSYDLINGWEIKHGQAHLSSKGTQRLAFVAGMKNKTSTLRVIITERLTGKLYYFKVPYEAYMKYTNSSLQWAFDTDGTPQRWFKRPNSRPCFWDYEVASFDALCSED